MLTKKQITEIRGHLEKAKNPIFFFDNDVDGLASFLILQRYIGAGKGVAVRGASEISASFFRRVEELNSDYIFVLDNSRIGDDFIKSAEEKGLTIVCIDHHDTPKPNIKNYYNTYDVSKKIEPTSYLCYKSVQKKEDIWLAVLGCISDAFIPEFLKDFKKQYPELIDCEYGTGVRGAYDIRYNSELGKIIHILAYGLLDKTSNVVAMLRFLIKARSPTDILEENFKTRTFLQRYDFINKKVQSVIQKAEKKIDKKKNLLYFTYSGDMSVSQYVSDELNYKYPEIVLLVGFIKGNSAKFSLRGPIDVRRLVLDSIAEIEGAHGGGHKHSSGAQMTTEDVPKFKKNFLENLEKVRKK